MKTIITTIAIIIAIVFGNVTTAPNNDVASFAGEFNNEIIIDNDRAKRVHYATSYVFPYDVSVEDHMMAEENDNIYAHVRISILTKIGQVGEGERFIIEGGEMYNENGFHIVGGTSNMMEGIYYMHEDGMMAWEAPLM